MTLPADLPVAGAFNVNDFLIGNDEDAAAGSRTRRFSWAVLRDSLAAALAPAWTDYTPSIAATAGTITTATATMGKYLKIGRLCQVRFLIQITTVGTGSGGLLVGLPFQHHATGNSIGAGRESSVTGTMLQGIIVGNGIVAEVRTYSNTTPIVAGWLCGMSIAYETAL